MDEMINRLRRLDPVPEPLGAPPIEPLLERINEQPGLPFRALGQGTGDARATAGHRRWLRSGSLLRSLPLLLAVTMSVAVAAVGLLVLGHHAPHPPATPPGGGAAGPPAFPHLSGRQRQQIDYVIRADGTVLSRDAACGHVLQLPDPAHPPSLSQGAPGPGILDTVGTLRRRATPADRLPPRKIWDGPHSRPSTYPYGTYPPVTGIYARYIRYARHRDGANYYLIPAQDINSRLAVPTRCYREQVTALRQDLAHIPRRLRPGIFALQATYLTYERRSTEPYPGVCLSALNRTGNGDGASCYAVSQIQTGHTLTSGAPGGVPVVYGLAPDGVSSVTFYYRSHHPGPTLTATVINNVFILHNPGQRLPNYGFPTKLVWRAANGRPIRTIRWS